MIMHSYLRAVGFSKLKNRKELDKVIGIVMDQPTQLKKIKTSDKETLTEMYRLFGEKTGIAIRGIYDEKGFFHLEHYFPFFLGQGITAKEDMFINKRVDTDAYTGMCDDLRLGVSLIFYLQNVIDFMETRKKHSHNGSHLLPVTLSGLSTGGKIILGIEVDEKKKQSMTQDKKQRNKLIAEAKEGNQEAIDSLTIEEIDIYAMISRRARREDIYSIVDNSFIPYGSESDNYSVLGTILDFNLMENPYTKEEVYGLYISCNDMDYSICINKKDLQGQPQVGRRFKGNIWMQGKVDFTQL